MAYGLKVSSCHPLMYYLLVYSVNVALKHYGLTLIVIKRAISTISNIAPVGFFNLIGQILLISLA